VIVIIFQPDQWSVLIFYFQKCNSNYDRIQNLRQFETLPRPENAIDFVQFIFGVSVAKFRLETSLDPKHKPRPGRRKNWILTDSLVHLHQNLPSRSNFTHLHQVLVQMFPTVCLGSSCNHEWCNWKGKLSAEKCFFSPSYKAEILTRKTGRTEEKNCENISLLARSKNSFLAFDFWPVFAVFRLFSRFERILGYFFRLWRRILVVFNRATKLKIWQFAPQYF